MSTKSYAMNEAERLLPLLRSVGREIRERTHAIDELEERLSTFSDDRELHYAEIARAEGELSLHRRELRRVEKELTQMGWNLDADHPLRIHVPDRNGSFTYEGEHDQTRFYRTPTNVRA